MFQEEVGFVCNASKAKVNLLKNNPVGYFLASLFGGMYIGFGILLIFTAGGILNAAGSPATKIVMGACFGVALSLVVIAGAELFTGNNFVMTVGLFRKEVTFKDTLVLWVVCWIGNLLGAVILGVLYHVTGLASGPVGEFIAKTSEAKMAVSFFPLLTRGILCNILVCIAVWCGFKCKSEAGKLIMIFWCLFVFITVGFEHSIANMTLLTVGLLDPYTFAVSLGGFVYNLLVVTLGNMIGGILFVAVPYCVIAKQRKK